MPPCRFPEGVSLAPPPRWLLVAVAVALSANLGCRRDEVTHARIPKGASTEGSGIVPPPQRAPGGERHPEGENAAGSVPPATPRAGALKWTLPTGWTETLTEGMRYATLKAPVQGRLEVSVVVLPGPAGGELSNVNRWRGQLGLPEVEETSLSLLRQPVPSAAGQLALYDFTSAGADPNRIIVGALSTADEKSWFLKMMGDPAVVGAARSDFLQLLGSLRLE